MSESHLKTKVFAEAAARGQLKAIAIQIQEIFARYELHSFSYTCSIGTIPEGSNVEGFFSQSEIFGCAPHNLAFLARFLGMQLELGDLVYFHMELQKYIAKKQYEGLVTALNSPEATPKTEPEKAPDEDDLLNMPLPKGTKWQN